MKDGSENDWLGYSDRESYLRDGLQLDPDLVEWALEGLQHADPEAAAPFTRMVELGKRGGDRRSEKARADQGNNITLVERGTSTAYTLARLKRDEPALAKRVEAGELSAHAAAIEAGFRERTISVSLEPKKAAAALIRHFSRAQLREIVRIISGAR